MDAQPPGPATSRTDRSGDDAPGQKARACANCARLKMKCQWPGSGSGSSQIQCARCIRMKIPCHVPTLPPRKKRGKGTRVAQLEQKIDGLVSLLAAGQQLQSNGSSPLTPESQESAQTNSQLQRDSSLLQDMSSAQSEPRRTPAPIQPAVDNGTAAFELIPEFRLTAVQAKTYLEVFRREYIPRFPCFTLDPTVTPAELYSQEPCLFWAIIATVAPLSPELQQTTKEKVREIIAEHVVVKRRKRLGNLQAILVYVAWLEFHIFFDSNATAMMSLAHSLIIDLKLDKSSQAIALPPRTLLRDAWDHFQKPGMRSRPELSSAEKRALLGYYHQAALVAAFYRRGQAPPWTAHFTQCCESLVEAAESQHDKHLVAMVDMQRVFDRAISAVTSSARTDTMYTAPLDMVISNARREIEDLISRQPSSIQNDQTLLLLKNSMYLRLYEPVFAMHQGSIVGPDPYSSGPYPRTDVLCRAMRACREFFDNFLLVPAVELTFMPSTYVALYAFTNVATSRILTADVTTDWDPAIARRSFDYVAYVKRVSDHFVEADQLAEQNGWKRRTLDVGLYAFTKFATKLIWISQWYLSRTHPEYQQQDQSQSGMESGQLRSLGSSAGTGQEATWADMAFETAWSDLMSFPGGHIFDNIPLLN